MNEIPKGVFTKSGYNGIQGSGNTALTPAAASWAEAKIFKGDLTAEIKELKSTPGKPILALGGAGFMRSLVATGLVDEYHLNTHPIVLGKGLPIFTDVESAMDMELLETKSFPGGIVARVYSK
jgi:dihydrofolate reductase